MTNEDDIYPRNPLRDLFRRRKPGVMSDGEPGTGFDYSKEGEEYQRQKVLRGNPIVGMGGQGVPMGQTQAQQAPASRPRTFRDVLQQRLQQPTPQNPTPDAATPADALPQQQPAAPFPDANAVRQRRTQPRDYIADDEAYLRDLERNKGSFWKRLAAAGIRGAQAATHQEVSPILTSREQEIADTQNRLGRELTVAQKRQQIESGSMVPFQLPDGTWTQVPLKQAAVLGSRQQSQQSTLSLRRQQMDAHNKRWDSMGKHEAAQDAQRLYNSGAADDNEDLRDEVARRMNLPEGTRLPPHTQGEVRVDANGNYIVVDKRAKTAAPVTQPSEIGTPQPVGSMQGTLEQGRNQRAAASIAARGTGAGRPASTVAANRLVREYNDARRAELDYSAMRNKSNKVDDVKKKALQSKRESLWQQIFDTYPGMFEADDSGIVKPKGGQAAAPQGGGVSEAQIRDAAKAKGLNPDTAVQRARARGIL